jgi:hypothetical protein
MRHLTRLAMLALALATAGCANLPPPQYYSVCSQDPAIYGCKIEKYATADVRR